MLLKDRENKQSSTRKVAQILCAVLMGVMGV
ncbi:hypothetical protein PARA125_000091 [Parachlamydia sp. AcF125]|nr:hypothetical protein [Parachlamydia sp. AcF125]